MKNKNNKQNKEYSEAYNNIVSDNTYKVLTETPDPVKLIDFIVSGDLKRFESWKIISLIHEGELDCNLPQYGILTVHCLAKDIKQFDELFTQGCDLLIEEKVLTEELQKNTFKSFEKKMKSKNKVFFKKSNKKQNKN